jgi:hypothetical protein
MIIAIGMVLATPRTPRTAGSALLYVTFKRKDLL